MSSTMVSEHASQALLQSMINHGIQYVFGIPGAKVDQLFETLAYSTDPNKPRLIITRHEQDAAFMAAAVGRLTGIPGVALVTSGPGVSNLATGLVTATAEGDPVIAIGGQVPRDDEFRLTHQSIDSRGLMQPITKSSVEVQDPNTISESFANAFSTAVSPKQGAAFISVPQDVMGAPVTREPIRRIPTPVLSSPDADALQALLGRIQAARLPVILAGARASEIDTAQALREFLRIYHMPVVETFQGAGIIPHELERLYFGRVGLFRNQPGDEIVRHSDLVIAVGYDPIEYEARNWNPTGEKAIVSIDSVGPEFSREYQPDTVFSQGIASVFRSLASLSTTKGNASTWHLSDESRSYLSDLRQRFEGNSRPPQRSKQQQATSVHPLEIIAALQQRVSDDTTVSVDVGSHYIWMARNFRSYQPRTLLFSNGMQTLGVGLPRAIAAALLHPDRTVVSVSGDGGFLFSGQELDMAVHEHLHIVQLIWNDGYYDMVRFQEISKYGHDAGVALGAVDFVTYAHSFGAKGIHVHGSADLGNALDWAFAQDGPVVVDIPVDYSENHELNESLIQEQLS